MTKIWAKTGIKISFFAQRAKKGLGLSRSPPQELEEGPRSGTHLLVIINIRIPIIIFHIIVIIRVQVSKEEKDLFDYINRYTPQKIDLDSKFKPFIPDYIPAVGDIDAFIKVLHNAIYGDTIDVEEDDDVMMVVIVITVAVMIMAVWTIK